jgi:WD40 repeat protein
LKLPGLVTAVGLSVGLGVVSQAGIAGATPLSSSAAAGERPPNSGAKGPALPADWIAFTSEGPWFGDFRSAVWATVPSIVLLKDGRIYWRDSAQVSRLGNDARIWRVGAVDPRKRAEFGQWLRTSGFLTISSPSQERYRSSGVHGPTTLVGLKLGGKERRVWFYPPPRAGRFDRPPRLDPETKAAAQFSERLRALIPGGFSTLRPDAIRVGFYPDFFDVPPGDEGIDWPNADRPEAMGTTEYLGLEAEYAIAALQVSSRIRVHGRYLRAWWVPIFDSVRTDPALSGRDEPMGRREERHPPGGLPRIPPQPPSDWAAFLIVYGGNTSRPLMAGTPDLLVYRDGRILRRDWRRRRSESSGLDVLSSNWQVGRMPRARLLQLLSVARRTGFFDQPAEPIHAGRPVMSDLPTTRLGVRDGTRERVIEIYAPSLDAKEPYADALTRSFQEVANALLAVAPVATSAYRPGTIRVGLFRAPWVKSAPPWALPELLPLATDSQGPFSYFSGEMARKLIEARTLSPAFRFEGGPRALEWSPAVTTPAAQEEAGSLSLRLPRRLRRTAPRTGGALGSPVRVLRGHRDVVCALAWSPDGRWLASGSPAPDDRPRVWDSRTGAPVETVAPSDAGPVTALCWRPSGGRLALMGTQAVRIAERGRVLGEIPYQGSSPGSVAWSSDGKWLAAGHEPQLWGAPRHAEYFRLFAGARNASGTVAFRPGSRDLAVASRNGEVILWAHPPDVPARVLRPRTRSSPLAWLRTPLAWNPSGTRLAVTGSAPGTIELLPVRKARSIRTLAYSGPPANALAWSPNGTLLAAASGAVLWVWDLRKGGSRRIDAGEDLHSCAWSPDGRRFAAGCADGTVRVWSFTADANRARRMRASNSR